ncbi:GtrA family protein [Haloarchaeobius salinus]|uniref:GtrA family protein n=1 Tax=Haloarchaeobius salinus TaxID=1198298 RepID=UPI00210BC53F|nr:GtrA family protein [Haloarchaeobius salinus]
MSEDDPVAGRTDADETGTDGGRTGLLDGDAAELVSGTRFGQFASVGVVGALFDVTTSTALKELGVFPELAVFIGIEVAVVVMFLLNDSWTFSGQGHDGLLATLRRLARSNLVRLGGITVQLATFRLVYRVIDLELTVASIDGWFVVSKVTGIGVAMFVNYVAESLFTWRVHAK